MRVTATIDIFSINGVDSTETMDVKSDGESMKYVEIVIGKTNIIVKSKELLQAAQMVVSAGAVK